MKYYKNVEIADKYNVSEVTIVKWVQDAKNNKNNLQLELFNKKLRVLDNEHNHAELTRLTTEGKKYRTGVSYRKVQPTKEFYKTFDIEEQIEIINDLRYRQEVNIKFYYKNGGAEMWDYDYKHSDSKMLSSTQTILNNTISDLKFISENKKINLIDIGCGNGYHTKPLLEQLDLSRYVAVDISKEMIEICKNNIKKWRPDLEFGQYICDIESSRFGKIFLDNHTNDVLNLVLFTGGTICNTNDRIRILKNFANGLLSDDILVFNYTLDSIESRSEFKFVSETEEDRKRAWVLSLLGIDVNNCEVEVVYNAEYGCKIKYLILDKDYNISFDLSNKIEEVQLYKGQKITRWKHFLLSNDLILEELQQANLGIQFLKVVEDNALIGVKLKA